jgi:phosphate transport system substrate-binding protein
MNREGMRAARAVVVALAALLAACGGEQTPPTGTASPALPGQGGTSAGAQINGAGATFPYPIYSKWFSEYGKAHPDVRINYQSIGSGGGIRQLTEQTVFFGASDGPMTDAQLKSAPGPIVHLPTVLGGVVPIYNVPGVSGDLQFTGGLLADIFLGKVTKWNDPAIAHENPGIKLPATDIAVAHRSDGSGTTYIFVDYLSKVSPAFKQKVGVATSVNWPTGVGGKGNEGVAGVVKQTPGAIGYVELIYALQNAIPYGAVKNRAGKALKATLESVTAAAAASAGSMPADFRVSITDPDAPDAYPIASYTWLLLYESPADKDKSRQMVDFVRWALTDGQAFAKDLGYAPLPASVVKLEQDALARIQVR